MQIIVTLTPETQQYTPYGNMVAAYYSGREAFRDYFPTLIEVLLLLHRFAYNLKPETNKQQKTKIKQEEY